MTKALLIASKQKKRLFVLYLKDKIAETDYTNYKNMVTTLLQQQKREYFSEYIENHNNQSKDVWALLNSILSRSAKKCKSNKFNDLNLLNQFFSSLGVRTAQNINP